MHAFNAFFNALQPEIKLQKDRDIFVLFPIFFNFCILWNLKLASFEVIL